MADAWQFYEMGLGDPFAISALQGKGMGTCWMLLWKLFQCWRKNLKMNRLRSPLLANRMWVSRVCSNYLVGKNRSIVSPIAGTTRDAVDTPMEFEGINLTLIDTAGIRKRGKIERGVEKYSVIRSMRAIERADVALLLIDATTGITEQDAHIAGFILEEWKSVVVVVNKWDAIEKDTYTMLEFTERIRQD